jgi:Delta3-Delta2-enoyl-CoA isomerase
LQKYKAGRLNMADKSVTVEYKGRIAVITIDNQKKLNAMTQDQYYMIAKFLREVATHDEVFVTVLTGKGRFFSA